MSVERWREGFVEVIRLNRPEARNALDPETVAGLGEGLLEAEADDGVRAVIITGAGDRAFCSGMDLRAFSAGRRGGDAQRPGLEVLFRRLYTKPVIAAVNGAAVAGGFEIVLACDLVVAAEHATFGMPEVKRGLVAAGGGTRVMGILPKAIALELGLTGEPIGAPRAAALGLVNRVVPAGDLMPEALGLARSISDNGPVAVRAMKKLMYDVLPETDWDAVRGGVAYVFETEDAKEGARAFVERRRPEWQGR